LVKKFSFYKKINVEIALFRKIENFGNKFAFVSQNFPFANKNSVFITKQRNI
jgi:hypothetical protein